MIKKKHLEILFEDQKAMQNTWIDSFEKLVKNLFTYIDSICIKPF